MTEHRHDEQPIARLLRDTQHAEAPVDHALLAQLRQQTLAVVQSASVVPSSDSTRYRPRTIPFWSRPMVRYSLALATTAMLVIGLSLLTWLAPTSGTSLADSLASVERLQSFTATQRSNLGVQQISYSKPGLLRIEQGTSYILHRPGQSWEVNETENIARRRQDTFIEDNQLSLRKLLRLPGDVDLHEEPVQVTTPKPGFEERLYHLGRSTLQLRWLLNLRTRQTEKLTLLDQIMQPMREEELTLTAINAPLAGELFQLKDTLTDDGRVGVVQDIQGIVMVRPVGRERWTPLAVGDLLKPGDMVRANPRGANAARLRLAPNTDVTFGPGATVELKTPTEYRLHVGEIEVHPRQRKITVISPAPSGTDKTIVEAKTVLRADADKLLTLKEPPVWLKGFQGTVVNESLGQLLAKVDDRNVPLNVGYHKVDVDIRDGLARTTVEESFLNTTNAELEGTFYFPLPSDASIAGFGMWIGNELIEADIVEKQRAREIFDIILSEKKDPALLEWAGGNLFKTRVYPIPARGEKRIKITYTQALPLEGNRFRYSYALLSDLLKQHPLKKLDITLTVSSDQPLARVHSPTHTVREEKAGTAARLVFSAQEYSPSRDFEAVIELASTPHAVTMLPHRRGEDGYFLMRLAPPQTSTGWERDIVRDGPPLHLLILCDTSVSIDKKQRGEQRAFVDALLGSLTARDTFNLACFDVETTWAFPQQQAADARAIADVQAMLQNRRSMGWTNFEKAFQSAQQQAALHAGTVIIYLGDGIPAMSWGHDPKVLVDRLKGIVSRDKAPVHAVALGALHEPQTLRAMASLSGGSWRKIAADRGAALQARDLLSELTDSALLRDLKLSFADIQTARVYPETLPNVQAGTGLVLTGRYLPGTAQTGTVTISGLRGNTPVKYQAQITLPAGDAGNSFIPRLWARQHIEALLESGGAANRDEIIARSEEFHLMTPYTSMLVLENDAMRERFAVKKRFQMRDGERFFADGRTQSELLLRQKQMRAAADWRVNLHRQTLARLGLLGKIPKQMNIAYGGGGGGFGGGLGGTYLGITPLSLGERAEVEDEFGIELGGNVRWDRDTAGAVRGMGGQDFGEMLIEGKKRLGDELWVTEQMNEKYDKQLRNTILRQEVDSLDFAGDFRAKDRSIDGPMESFRFSLRKGDDYNTPVEEEVVRALTRVPGAAPIDSRYLHDGIDDDSKSKDQLFFYDSNAILASRPDLRVMSGAYAGRRMQGYSRSPYPNPLNLQQLFPSQAPAPLIARPSVAKPPVWSPEVTAILQSLDQRAAVRKLEGAALLIDRVTESYDVRRQALSNLSKRTEYLSALGWHTIQASDQSPTLLEWCTPTERTILNLAYLTGRSRSSSQPEQELLPIAWSDRSLEDIVATYGQLPAKLDKLPDNLIRITLTYPETLSVHWYIDTQRKVLVKVEHLNAGKTQSTETFADFQQVAGRWWATRHTVTDAQGRLVSQSVQHVQAIAPNLMVQKLAEAKKLQADCFMLTAPLLTLTEAKQAVAPGGPGGAMPHLVMLSHYAATQQWPRVREHLAQLEKLPKQYTVVPLIRLLVQYASRDHANMQNDIWKQTAELIQKPLPSQNDDWSRFHFLQNQLSSVASANEMLRYLEAHAAPYQRQPAHLRLPRERQKQQAQYLANAGRREEALALWKRLATSDVYDASVQWSYFSTLLQVNDYDLAYRHFMMLLEPQRQVFLSEDDSQQYWQQLYSKLHEMGHFAEMFTLASTWVKRQPNQRLAHQAYLLALILTEQEKEFHRTQLAWIVAGPGPKSGTVQDRQFESALSVALHQTYFGFEHQWHRQQQQLDERLHAPLIAFAEAHLLDPRQVNYIQQVLSSVAGNSARGIALRESLPARMADAASELTIEQLNVLLQYSHYTSSRNPEMTRQHQAQWATAAARLKTRWSSLNDPKAKHAMGNLLSQVLPRVDSTGYLPFLRERLVQEAPEYHLGLRSSLYHHLFSQELTAAIETELFNLLPQLDAPEQPGTTILYARITRFQQLVERLLQDRTSKLHAAIKDKEKLDRVKLQEQQTAATREAHRQVAVRLQQRDVVQLTPLVPWIAAEEIFHRIKAGEAPAGLAASTWSAFEALPAATKVKPEDIKTFDELDQFRTALLYEGLRDRHLTVLTYLATLPKAQQPAASEKLKTFLIGKLSAEPANDYWRANWQRLLIALDQPKELEASLREWVLTSGTDQQYRLMLAYLQAERGGLQEAVALLEKVKADDELAPADWRALSDWLLVLNEQARHRQAKVEQYATASEQALYGFLQKQHALVSRQGQGVPSSLNEDTFLVIPELFRKTQSPTNYFHMVQALYEATKDFRLLTGLADGTLGHTPGNVYQLLQSWRQLISVLQEEATLDELSKRISLLRQSTTSNVDRRVLDLLQAFLHRKAATQINQPGDHAKLAIECLQRAMKHSWHPEEPAALAQLILQLHQEDHAAWKEELQTVYSKLMELTKPGSPERATVAFYYSLYHPQPFQLLEKMICEVRAHQPSGLLPEFSQQIVGAYLNMSIGHEQATEALAQQELARPGYSTASREWFKQQLHAIYLRAYQNKGTVSLGTGTPLYRALETLFENEALTARTLDRRTHYLHQLNTLYHDARRLNERTVQPDCLVMLTQRIVPVLKALGYQRRDIVTTFASTVHDIVGAREAMKFLLDEYDRAPFSVRRLPYDGWDAYHGQLAAWRPEVKDTVILDRYFQIVLKRLSNYLLTGNQQSESFMKGHNYYWAEKEEAFAAAAITVFTSREPNKSLAERVAQYLRSGIDQPARAIDFLKSIRTTAAFDEGIQYLLASILMERNRHEEAVRELLPLFRSRPALHYGLNLMTCYHALNQREPLQRTLADLETRFAPKGEWPSLSDMSQVALTCYHTALYHDAERLYAKLIPLYRQADKTLRMDNLWNYYRFQALTLVELDKTGPALESISSAIVIWGGSFQQRSDVLDCLRTVMRRAKDPQVVITRLDDTARKNAGRENVLLRRVLAEVLLEQQKHGLAVSQLKTILEIKPDDDAASKLLIQAFDALNQPAEALAAALHRSEFVSRQTATWQELGDRLTKMKDSAAAERAYTSLIEVLPNDADSEMALAKVREGQNRWDDAIIHWKLARDYRAEDPSGLLGLAAAYVHTQRWPDAKATLDQLRKPAKPWHQRFNNLRVNERVEELQRQVK